MRNEFDIEHIKMIKNDLPFLKACLKEEDSKSDKEYIDFLIQTIDDRINEWLEKNE